MLDHFLGRFQRDVPGRCVDVVDVGEDELQGASLGPQHQVNVFDVALECVVDLLFRQEHQADHPHTKGKQSQA